MEDLSLISDAMERLRREPPKELAGLRVVSAEDLADGAAGSDEAGDAGRLPPTDGLRYRLDGAYHGRVIVRPSGTEPKLKCYLEVVIPVAGASGLPAARLRGAELLEALKQDIGAAAGI